MISPSSPAAISTSATTSAPAATSSPATTSGPGPGRIPGPAVSAFFAQPATVPVGEPTALGLAAFNPTPTPVLFTFTATLPAHLRIAPVGGPPANTCGGPVTTSPDGTRITTWGRIVPGPGGCGVILPIIADQPGTYRAAAITLSDTAGVPAALVDIAAACGEPCAALVPALTVTAEPSEPLTPPAPSRPPLPIIR